MNLRYIGAMMVVVRSLVAGLNLIVRPASGHPLADIKEPLRFVAMGFPCKFIIRCKFRRERTD
jgi:O-succinylbenzoic acid--CoA ligase